MVVTCRLGTGQPLHLVDDTDAVVFASPIILYPATRRKVVAKSLWITNVAAMVPVPAIEICE